MKTFLMKAGCVVGVMCSIYVGIIYDIHKELSKPDVQVAEIDFDAIMANRAKPKHMPYPDFDLEHLSIIAQEDEDDKSRTTSDGEYSENPTGIEGTESDNEAVGESFGEDEGAGTDSASVWESVSELVESEPADNGYVEGSPKEYDDGGDSESSAENGSEEDGLTYLGQFTATAYCPCEICCGVYSSGYTASGTYATEGRTIACNSLPFGTQVMIDGNIYTVEDTGWSPYGENWIDIFFYDHNSALAYGMRTVDVYLVG